MGIRNCQIGQWVGSGRLRARTRWTWGIRRRAFRACVGWGPRRMLVAGEAPATGDGRGGGMAGKLVGRTVREIAEAVRTGSATPADAVREHLEQIDALNDRVGAFLRVRRDAALTEADAVA